MPKAEREIGVVIVTFNSEATIGAALRSISSSSLVQKIVVVDNCSSDDTAARVSEFADRVELLVNTGNVGFGAAANIGAARIESPLIAFVNPDARADEGTFETLSAFLNSSPSSVWAVGPALINDAGFAEYSARMFPTPANALFTRRWLDVFPRVQTRQLRRFLQLERRPDETFECDWLSGAFLLLRNDVFRALGGFDPSYFLYYEDVDLFERARRAGFTGRYVGSARAFHSIGGSSSGVSIRAAWWRIRSFYRYYRKSLRRGISSDIFFATMILLGIGIDVLSRLPRRKNDEGIGYRGNRKHRLDAGTKSGRKRV